LLKTEEFEIICLCILSNSLPLRVLPLIQEGEFFLCFSIGCEKLLLLDKRRWIQLAEDGGV
jgi:predicted DNA repair protein MutK